jgi:hypothetical protein
VTLPGVDRYYVIEEGKGVIPSVYDAIAKEVPTRNAATAGK